MTTFSFNPGPCYDDKGRTYRPFLIDGKEVYRLDMAVMIGEDKDASNAQLVGLCEKIKEITGSIMSPAELPEIIKTRKIVVDNA